MRTTKKVSLCLAALLLLRASPLPGVGEPALTATESAMEMPTAMPAEVKTESPTEVPSEVKTEMPTESPTAVPTESPTEMPTEMPTESPTETPTEFPTELPTEIPTELPTETPTALPTETPTALPTETPSASPTLGVDERWLTEGLTIAAEGETERFIEVSGDAEWRAVCDAEWVRIEIRREAGGLAVEVLKNDGEERSCVLQILAEGCETLTISLIQRAAAPTETLEPGMDEDQNPDDLPDDENARLEPAERRTDVGWKGVVRSDERGMAIPLLLQGDYDATVLYYNGQPRSVATSGCGATSVSMVIAYLTGDTSQNPYTLFCAAVDAGKYHGNGLSHETLSWLAESHGVKTRWISGSREGIAQALEQGKPVIAHMGEGIFTRQGHYIVLRGLTEDGKVLVNDPASASRSGMAFPMETILSQTRTSNAFMVCSIEAQPTPEPSDEPTQPPALPMDVNGSGRVDVCDAQVVYDVMMATEEVPDELRAAADVNGDGQVDVQDIQCVIHWIQTQN